VKTMQGNPVNRLEQVWAGTATSAESAGEGGSWTDKAQTWQSDLERYISDNPKVALAAAAAAGLVLGWLVKRK
jgi:ElaB/YqjD/DUF883 family membrane-anchored ribosome-binding protein